MGEPIIVDTAWLSDHVLDSGQAIVDVRPPQFYMQEHIPGAVNLPVFFLSGPRSVPEAQGLAQRLGDLGIDRDTAIVAYDDGASPSAALLYRVLDYYRHPAVSILDGGITKWAHEGRELEFTAVTVAQVRYEIRSPDESLDADLPAVRAASESDDTVILDVRSPGEYLGLQVTAQRNGHIPGSVNVEWSNSLERGEDAIAAMRPDAELRDLYREAGVTPDKRVIVYCQSGGRASHTYMVLKKLGYPRVAVYGPGWQEWGNRADTEVEEP